MSQDPCRISVAYDCLIPVRWAQRALHEPLTSLRDLLARAQEIDSLDVGPLEEAALVRRLILPVVLDSQGAPTDRREWAERFRNGHLDIASIDRYLETYRDRFLLFDPDRPFDQVGGLQATNGRTKPSSLLLTTSATGNNVPLFYSRTEADPPPLDPSQALLALVCAHAWDTAAIKTGARGDDHVLAGKTTGNPTGPLGGLGVVMPRGANLFETIMLNTPIEADARRVAGTNGPWWRRAPAGPSWESREATDLLDLLTWQARRIRLIPETTPHGVVVRQVVLTAGDRLARPPLFDPHTQWRKVRNPGAARGSHRPVLHQADRAGWQGLASLLAVSRSVSVTNKSNIVSSNLLCQIADLVALDVLPEDYPLDTLIVGVEYGKKSAVVENVVSDVVPLPVRALAEEPECREAVLGVVQQAEALRRALNRLEDNIHRSSGARVTQSDRGQRSGDRALYTIGVTITEFLLALRRSPDDLDRLCDLWETEVWETVTDEARTVARAAPPSALWGRPAGHTKAAGGADRTDPGKPLWRDNTATAMAAFRRDLRRILPGAVAGRTSARAERSNG